MKMKKLLLGLGTLAAVAAPVAAVVACGVDESKVNYVFNRNDKVLKDTIAKDKDHMIPAAHQFVAQTITDEALKKAQAIDPSKTAEDFLPYIITETQVTDGADVAKTREFTKGSAVNIIKTVVQYIKDLGADKADTFSIVLYAKIVQKTKYKNITKSAFAYTTAVDNTAVAKKAKFTELAAGPDADKKIKYIKVNALTVSGKVTIPAHYEDAAGNIVANDTGEAGSLTLAKGAAAYSFKAAPVTLVTDDSKTGTATLKIDLKGATEVKDITEKLIVVKASNKSTPNDEVKAEAYVVAPVTTTTTP